MLLSKLLDYQKFDFELKRKIITLMIDLVSNQVTCLPALEILLIFVNGSQDVFDSDLVI